MNIFKTLIGRRELIANLVSRELKSKYKGSVLGVLWSLLTPLFMAVIYIVFLRFLAGRAPMAQVIIGVFAWQFTISTIQDGVNAITGNTNLVKKVFFPRIILPVSITLANLVNYLLSLLVQFPLILLLLYLDMEPGGLSLLALALPGLVVYHTLLNAGFAMLLSSANVYFRDTRHVVGVSLSAWFFMSPVMYNLAMIKKFTDELPWVENLYLLNPMAGLIEAYRSLVLTEVDFPDGPYVLIGLAWPMFLLVIAYAVFQKTQKNFSDML